MTRTASSGRGRQTLRPGRWGSTGPALRGIIWVCAALATLAACSTNPDDGGGTDDGLTAQCKADEQKYALIRKAKLQVSRDNEPVEHGDKVTAAVTALAAGTQLDTVFSVRNLAEAESAKPLIIKEIQTVYKPAEGQESEKPAFTCLVRAGQEEFACGDTDKLGSVIPAGMDTKCLADKDKAATSIDIVIRFLKPDDNLPRTMQFWVHTDGDEDWKGKGFKVEVTTKEGKPKIGVSPGLLEFESVSQGGTDDKTFKILNTGEANLKIDMIQVALKDNQAFSIEVLGKTYAGGKTYTLDPPLEVQPQKTLGVVVTFSALDQNGHMDEIKVFSNDTLEPEKTVLLRANQKVPCIQYVPPKLVNFGFVFLGTTGEKTLQVKNCGSDEARVTDLTLTGDKDDVFGVDTSEIASLGGKPISEANPLLIPVNGKASVKLKCAPEQADAPYKAQLLHKDNTLIAQKDKVIDLLCSGTNKACPTPVINGDEEIIPQMELPLTGDKSFASPGKKVVTWEWKVVEMPKGAQNHAFYPNAKAPNVQFGVKKDYPGVGEKITVNIAGKYVFQLNVYDDSGAPACAPAIQVVSVIPDEAIHVELLWDTPEDKQKVCAGGDNADKPCTQQSDCPDSSCEHDTGLSAGTDMDLHFAHQDAMLPNVCQNPPKMCGGKACACQPDNDGDGKADPWFHPHFDCYWLNPNPNWANSDPQVPDNPGLDLDDTDGWGPENLNLKEAENKVEYWVGVHYWKAYDFGASTATLRFYILGNLELEMVSKPMNECDMWWAKRIEWPSGKLLDIDAANGKVTPKYTSKVASGLGAKCAAK